MRLHLARDHKPATPHCPAQLAAFDWCSYQSYFVLSDSLVFNGQQAVLQAVLQQHGAFLVHVQLLHLQALSPREEVHRVSILAQMQLVMLREAFTRRGGPTRRFTLARQGPVVWQERAASKQRSIRVSHRAGRLEGLYSESGARPFLLFRVLRNSITARRYLVFEMVDENSGN